MQRGALIVAGALVALGFAEVAVRALKKPSPERQVLHRTMLDRPYLYGLAPEHPEISTRGLRDREFQVPKPAGVTRILLLGDSVVYGVGVERDETLSRLVERRLGEIAHGTQFEVLNAGVHGWSPWNQLRFYEAEAHSFDVDVVVAVFCMNDVVDPRLHWRYSRGLSPAIPEDAVPNPRDSPRVEEVLAEQERDRQRQRRFPLSWLRRSAVFREVSQLFNSRPEQTVRLGGRTWRTQITGEDIISIEVLTNRQSPEWRWLARVYRELRDAVRSHGRELLIASVPLATQLEPDYPFVPQKLLAAFCKELGVAYVSTLPALLGHPVEDVFLGSRMGYDDIWHLTPKGLASVAVPIADHVARLVLPRLQRP